MAGHAEPVVAAPAAADTAADTAAAEPRAGFAAWWGLAVLMLLGLYAVMDRQVLSLQAEAIRVQLGLSDFQLGLVQGLGVALFTAVVGYPIGWLADRYDRRKVLAGCIVVWSLSVVACGLARDFNELFLASALVGAGEAGLLPIGYALIPELFRQPRQRQLANSVFIVTGRLTVGLVIALCGWMIHGVASAKPWLPEFLQQMPPWRLAFFAAALPGVVFVPLILTMPLRNGGRALASAAGAVAGAAAPVLPFLRAQWRTFASFYVGVGLMVFGYGAVGGFVPVVAVRQFGATPLEVGNAVGTATFVSALLGLAFSTWGMRWVAPRVGAALPVRMVQLSALTGAATALMLLATSTPLQFYVVLTLHLTTVLAGAMLFPTALQELCPAPLRARLVSIIIMVNIVLASLSPAVVGFVSDRLKPRPDALLLAMTCTAAVAMVVGTAALVICARRYAATAAAARAMEGGDPAKAA